MKLPIRPLLTTLSLLWLSLSIVFGQSDGDYQSRQAGNWSTVTTWQVYNSGAYQNLEDASAGPYQNIIPSDASGLISVKNTVTVTADIFIDDTTITSAGNLILNSGINLDFPVFYFFDVLTINGTLTNNGNFNLGIFSNVSVFGTFINNQGASINNDAADYFLFESGSTYDHRYTTSAGTIPLAAWDVASTCLISGYTSNSSPPGNLNQSFGNFTWNVPSYNASFINLSGQLTSVTGDLRIVSTGGSGKSLRFASTGEPGFNLTIGGNLRLEGGIVQFVLNTSSPTQISIDKDYIQSGTNLVMTQTAGNVTVNIKGNFNKSGGTISRLASGVATFNFNGGTGVTQTYSFSGTNISSAVNFTVPNTSTLNIIGENNIMGSGTFTLAAGGTLGVASANGLVKGIGSGNIRTSVTRVYTANGTIVYNGITQNLGDEWSSTGALNGIAVNLQITGGAVVTNNNSGSTNLVGVLSLTSGRMNIGGSNSLTVQGVFNSTASGTIGGASDANLTFGGSGSMGTLYFAPGAETLNNLTVGRTGTLTLGSNLTVGGSGSGTINLSFGNLDFSGRTLTMNGSAITPSGGTGLLSNSSSNLVFGGATYSGSVPFNGTGNQLRYLEFATPGGSFTWDNAVTIIDSVKLKAGTIIHSSGLKMGTNSTFVREGGSITTNTPDVVTSFNVKYNGSVPTGFELPSSTTQLNNLIISGGPITLNKNITVNGNVTILSSTLNSGGFDITMKSGAGSWTRTSGSFEGGAGKVVFDGNTTIVAIGVDANFTNITVNSTRTLTLPTGNINIGGNLINNGTITPSSSTAIFNGSTTISGSSTTSFNNVTVSGTLVAPASTVLSIAGDFTNDGTFNSNNGSVTFNGNTSILGTNQSNFNNITLTGTLAAPTSTSLGIRGNLTNSSGTFNNNNGTVLFNGTIAAQTVSGSPLTFNNITVSNPVTPGVNINSNVRLNGTLTLTAGAFFDADGTGSGVFIVSSTSQTAGGQIANLPSPGNFVGAVTVERFIHGKTGGDYRYLSMPITNGNLSMWTSPIGVTGNFSDRSTNPPFTNILNSGNTNPSVQTFNSTTQAFVNVNGSGGLTSATSLSNATGYAAYDYLDGAVTASYRGTIGKGSVAVTISSTNNNFNLVPNPYPSPIDWDNVTKTNVNNAMYLRVDPNVFSSYVGGVASNVPFVGWTGEIATGQSFWVTSNGSGSTLTLKEGDKTSNQYHFLRTKTADDYFRMSIISASGIKDESVLRFAADATDGFDNDYDAIKLKNGSDPYLPLINKSEFLNLSTYLDGAETEFAINTIDKLKGPKIVRMNIEDVKVGAYSLSFTDLSLMYEPYLIVLVDTFLQQEIEVTDDAVYAFTVNDNPQSKGKNRFHLRINGSAVVTGTVNETLNGYSVYPNPVTDKLYIQLTQEQQSNLRSIGLVNVIGNTVLDSRTDSQLLEPGDKIIDMSNFSAGIYMLNIQCGDKVITTKVIKK